MNYFEILDDVLTPYLEDVFNERIGDTRADSPTALEILQEVKNLALAYRLPTNVLQKPDNEFYPNLRRVIALSSVVVERIRNIYQVIEMSKRLRDQMSEAVLRRRRERLTPANYNSLNRAEQNAFNNTDNLTLAQILMDIRVAAPNTRYTADQSQLDQDYHNTLLLLRKNITAQTMYVFVKRELEALLRRMRERFANISLSVLEMQHGLSQDDVNYLTTRDYIQSNSNANQISMYYGRSINLVRNTQGYVETVKQRIANLVSIYVKERYSPQTFKMADYARVNSVNEEIKRNLNLLDRWSVERTNDVNEMFRDIDQHNRYTTKIERIKYELENNANGGGALEVMNPYKTAMRALSLNKSLQQLQVGLATVLRNIKQRVQNMNRHFSLLAENHLSINGTLHSLENMFRRITDLTGTQTAYTFDQFLRQVAAKFFDEHGNPLNNNGAAITLNNVDDQYRKLVGDERQDLNNAFAQIDNVRLRNEEHNTLEQAQEQIIDMPLISLNTLPEVQAQVDNVDNNHGGGRAPSSVPSQSLANTSGANHTLLSLKEALKKMRADEKINNAALAEAKCSIETMRAEHEATLAEVQQLRQLVNNPNIENTQQLQDSTLQLNKLDEELTAKKQIVLQQEAALRTKEQTIAQLEKERVNSEARSNTQLKKIQALNKSLTESHAHASALESRLEAVQASLTVTDSSNDQQNLKIDQLTTKVNQLMRTLSDETSRYQILAEKHATAEHDIAEFTRIITETRNNLKEEALRDAEVLANQVEQAKSETANTRRLHKEELNRAREEFDKAQREYREKIATLEAQNARLVELQRTAKEAYDAAPTSLNQQLAIQAQQTIEGLSKENEELKLYANSLEDKLTSAITEASTATMDGAGDGKNDAFVASINDTAKELWQNSNKMDQQLRQMNDSLNNAEAVVTVATSIVQQQPQPPNKRPIYGTNDSDDALDNDYITTKKHIIEQPEQLLTTKYGDANAAVVATTNTSTTSTFTKPLPSLTTAIDNEQQQQQQQQQRAQEPTLPLDPEWLPPPSHHNTLVRTAVHKNKVTIKRSRRSKIDIKIDELSRKEIREIVGNVLPIQSAKFYTSEIEDKLLLVNTSNRRALYAACLLKYVDKQSEFDSLMQEFDESYTALSIALAYTRYVDRESTYRHSILRHSIDEDYKDRHTLNDDVYYSEPEHELSTKSHRGPTNTQALLQQYDKQNVYVEPSDEALNLYDKLFGDRITMSYNEHLFDELLDIAEHHEPDLSVIRRYTFFDYRWHNYAAPTRAMRFKFGLNPDNMDPMPVIMLYVILHFRVFSLFSALPFQVYDTGNQLTLNKIINLYIVYKNSMTLLEQQIYEQYIRSMFSNALIDWDELIANKTKSLIFFCANITIKPWLPYKAKLQAFVLSNNRIEDDTDPL